MKSMTGYGKGISENSSARITAEVRSLNSKALRVRFSMGKVFNPFLNDLNSLISKYVKRGDLELSIHHVLSPNVEVPISVNYSEAVNLVREIKKISSLSGEEISVSLRDLSLISDIFQREELDSEIFREPLFEAVEEALLSLDESRKREGEKLKSYFLEKLKVIEEEVRGIEEMASQLEELLFKKLKERVRKLLSGEELPEEFERRIELEVALLAEKQDVSEEISRLKVHIDRFRELLNLEGEPVGKTLDFLCQEMHREINTLGSKLKEIDVTEPILKIKTEIARIKEQVQNVE
jgi:uncharacterized protein (TIGR00255 family)